MKKLLPVLAMVAATSAFGQDAKVPPTTSPAPPGYILCDVIYTTDITTTDAQGGEHNIATGINTVWAIPYADALDNSKKGLVVVDLMSKLQDKGGPYDAETSEIRNCDGKGQAKYAPTSVLVRGVTLEGANQIAREALKQGGLIVTRYEDRQKGGAKVGWDHAKASKTKRDDLGRRKVDLTQ